MLFSRMDKYQRAGIPFSVNIANEEIETILSSTDLIRLISNLLDNAYEATLEMPNAERKIELEIVKVNDTVKLVVKNTSILKEMTDNYFKIGYSTKSKSDRGFGLAIIQEVTEKYNGFLEVGTKDNVVSIEISFSKLVEK